MSLQIYNSLTQDKEVFTPIEPGKVKMYVCGMTVYDFCHLGHMRMLTAFDVVARYFRYSGYELTYVRNVTDVDDKIIRRAQENGEEYLALAQRFTQAMHKDLAILGLLPPTLEPRATEFIEPMVALIETLISKGYAYAASNGDVYYKVREFKDYGCLSHHSIDDLESGSRIEVNEMKTDPLDFVLWKHAKPGEPSWQSPWGQGRPGWHIECSAMSLKLLGEHFDIHGGGKDLIFPHHENEIAQSVAATGNKFANLWMHNGHVQINSEKMSKSQGNFMTIRDLLKEYPAEAIRYFVIASHYRSPLQFTKTAIPQAFQALERFYLALRGLEGAEVPVNSDYEARFKAAMDDDFNTPIALAVLFDLAHEIQRLRESDAAGASVHGALLRHLGGVLGILQTKPGEFLKSAVKVDVAAVDKLIADRIKARNAKDWAEADRIRAELTTMSVEVEDNPTGSTWRVKL